MGFFDFLFSVNAGVKSAGRTSSPASWKYDDLKTTPYLYGSEYLGELYKSAKEDWQKDAVYDHMVRYDVLDKGCKGYERIRKKHDD